MRPQCEEERERGRDHTDDLCLLVDGQVVVNDADTSLQRDGTRPLSFCHCIHW